ncbi:MAG: hypothetical protein IJ764_04450 [Bacteroidales bacterium]|nr:hypothetical protein [Bacteroidales bacterium]
MFFTPKPRQFHYEPRFYDPEKEKWEALKKKYASEESLEEATAFDDALVGTQETVVDDDDLRYFESKIHRMDRESQRKSLGIKDFFQRREMPKFNYQPRFQSDSSMLVGHTGSKDSSDSDVQTKYSDEGWRRNNIRIRRRYNMDDPEYMKPVSASKIMMYVLLACLLLYWILF